MMVSVISGGNKSRDLIFAGKKRLKGNVGENYERNSNGVLGWMIDVWWKGDIEE